MLARLRSPSRTSPSETLTRDGSAPGSNGTTIVPVLDVPISGEANLVWCGAFQLAWNEACDWFKHPIELRPPSALAETLNQRSFDRRSVDEASIFVASGAMKDGIVRKIKAGVKGMSREEARLLDGLQSGGDAVICYARLKKALRFPKPFRRLGNYALKSGKAPCFGFLGEHKVGARREQALIHDYRGPDDFVVQLETTEPEDMLVLAKVPAGATLRETTQGVVERLSAEPEPASGQDVLVAPCIHFSNATSFSELQGRVVMGDSLWFLTRAFQSIDFAMNEQGVILVSIGLVQFARGLGSFSSHIMILNPPFLLLMKRKDAKEPYFASWIVNADPLKLR
jgi:hypothetical protein